MELRGLFFPLGQKSQDNKNCTDKNQYSEKNLVEHEAFLEEVKELLFSHRIPAGLDGTGYQRFVKRNKLQDMVTADIDQGAESQ